MAHLNRPEMDERWKKRFRIKVASWSLAARSNPERGLLAHNQTGIVQLYAWDIPTGKISQLTDFPTGKRMGTISPDGSHIYFLKDNGSNEIGHFVRVPFGGGEMEDITPDLPPYSSFDLTFSADSRLIVLMTANRDGFRLFALDNPAGSKPGQPRQIYHSTSLTQQLAVSSDGRLAATTTTELSGKLQPNLVVVSTRDGRRMAECWDGEGSSMDLALFSPLNGDSRLLATTNRSGFVRPFLWNPETGQRTELDLPGLDGDAEPIDWSPDGKNILLAHSTRAVQTLYRYEIESQTLFKLNHPSGSFVYFRGLGTYYHSNDEIFAEWEDSSHPAQLIALDAHTGEPKQTLLPAEDVPPCRPWRSVLFNSSDGQEIQAWLATPQGQGPFPAILDIHGGPSGVTTERFDAKSQAWLDHGFAFLSINYRGSTTFGRDFQDKIIGNLGCWEMEDIAAAHNYLVSQGIADPQKIFITGWSYGGYLTLLAAGKRPEYWAGGMAGIAIADWALMYEDQAETLRGYQVALFGGTPQQKPEQHRASSPITYAEQVCAPLLIIQGSNDTRCPVRQMQAYLDKMSALGKDVKIRWFEAGHGSAAVEQTIEHMEQMLEFVLEKI